MNPSPFTYISFKLIETGAIRFGGRTLSIINFRKSTTRTTVDMEYKALSCYGTPFSQLTHQLSFSCNNLPALSLSPGGCVSSSTMRTEAWTSWWSTSPLPSALSCEYFFFSSPTDRLTDWGGDPPADLTRRILWSL